MKKSSKVVSLAAFQQSRKPQAAFGDSDSSPRIELDAVFALSVRDREEILRGLTACAVTAMENRARLFEQEAARAVPATRVARKARRLRVLPGGRGG